MLRGPDRPRPKERFEIQESPAGGVRRAIDTGLESPLDIAEPGEEPPVASRRYRVLPRSVVVLALNQA